MMPLRMRLNLIFPIIFQLSYLRRVASALNAGTLCPSGYYVERIPTDPSKENSETKCIPCPIGTIGNGIADHCRPCPEGTYASEIASAVCTACDRGFYANEKGSAKCKPCEVGYFQSSSGQASCNECRIGTYTNSTGQIKCATCLAGTYSDKEGSTTCVDCPKGKFQSRLGQSYCLDCPLGEFTDEKGSSQCKQCEVGTFANTTSSVSCVMCPVGHYQDKIGQDRCEQCEQGTASEEVGAVSSNVCAPCLKGYYQSKSGKSKCHSCVEGTFSDELGATSCESCSPGEFTNTTASESCTPCHKGQYQSLHGQSSCKYCNFGEFQSREGETQCKGCMLGEYQNEIGQPECKKCRAGTYSNDFVNGSYINCKECEVGTYQSEMGQHICNLCGPGTYQDIQGGHSCKKCRKGTYSFEVGANTSKFCLPCPRGTYTDEEGQHQCKRCEPGTYNDLDGQSSCKLCEEGNHTVFEGSSKCNECPFPLANFNDGNTHCSVCMRGYYLKDISVNAETLHEYPREYCLPCPIVDNSTDCSVGTTLANITIRSGYWRATKNTSQIYKCNFASACSPIDNSLSRHHISPKFHLMNEYCAEGYHGALCEQCTVRNQYFDKMKGQCKTCRPYRFLIYFAVIVVLILPCTYAMLKMKRYLMPLATTIASLNMQCKLKIFVGFYQIMSCFTDVYGVALHDQVKGSFHFMTNVFSFDFLSSFPLECIGTIPAFIISGLWPYILFLLIVACYQVLKLSRRNFNTRKNHTLDHIIEKISTHQIIIFVFYFALPVVSKHIFDAKICEAFKTDDENDTFESYLVSSKTIRCDASLDNNFKNLQIIFWVFFTVWPCLTLMGFAVLVSRIFSSVRHERPTALAMKCQFLWSDFDQTSNIAIYWDIIDFFRKLFLVGFINFIDQNEGSNKLLRLTVAVAVSSAFMLILLYVRPYKRQDDFQLSMLSSFLITLAFSFGYILKICENEDDGACKKYVGFGVDDSLGASILVTILVILMLVITIVALIIQTRYAPIARLKQTSYPPNLNLPEDCEYHVFMSHKWKGGQDKCHSIARKLQLYMTELKVWLDVDNLSNTDDLEQSVKESGVFLLSYSQGYFESKNCRREFFQALLLDKPIIVVYDGDNSVLNVMAEECSRVFFQEEMGNEEFSHQDFKDEIEAILDKNGLAESEWKSNMDTMRRKVSDFVSLHLDSLAIQWLKTGSFSAESLKMIYLRILECLPYYKNCTNAPLLSKGLSMPNDEKIPKLRFRTELLFSSFNIGAVEIANEIQNVSHSFIKLTYLIGDEENRVSVNVDVPESEKEKDIVDAIDEVNHSFTSNHSRQNSSIQMEELHVAQTESNETQDRQEEYEQSPLLQEDTELQTSIVVESLLTENLRSSFLRSSTTFKVFLFYLNKDMFEKQSMLKFQPILKAIILKNIPVIVIHEQDCEKGAIPNFDSILQQTPDDLMVLYEDIAIPIYSRKEYRYVSLCQVLHKMNTLYTKRK